MKIKVINESTADEKVILTAENVGESGDLQVCLKRILLGGGKATMTGTVEQPDSELAGVLLELTIA